MASFPDEPSALLQSENVTVQVWFRQDGGGVNLRVAHDAPNLRITDLELAPSNDQDYENPSVFTISLAE